MKVRKTFILDEEAIALLDSIYIAYFQDAGKKTTYSKIISAALNHFVESANSEDDDEKFVGLKD